MLLNGSSDVARIHRSHRNVSERQVTHLSSEEISLDCELYGSWNRGYIKCVAYEGARLWSHMPEMICVPQNLGSLAQHHRLDSDIIRRDESISVSFEICRRRMWLQNSSWAS